MSSDCPLTKCRWTFGGCCETHVSGCPEHDCSYCGDNKPAAARVGQCSVCMRTMRIKKDGTIRHHGGEYRKGWPYGREYRCNGSDRPPLFTDGAA